MARLRIVPPIFDTVCTLPLSSDLFTQAVHPGSPLIALGLASGHVQLHRLPHRNNSEESPNSTTGQGTIETAWRTRRHRGSCRSVSFDQSGEHLFSAGTDGLVKAAATETGQVISKIAVPLHNCVIDPACLVRVLSSQSLLLATDSSALYIYDLRAPDVFATSLPRRTYHPHDDYISSLSPLPLGETSTSGFSKQWISTGGSTIALTDLRKGLLEAEDLGEELLSSIVGDAGKVLVGGEKGVLRIWNKGLWNEEDNRVWVQKGESLDTLSVIQGTSNSERIMVGMGNGRVKVVEIKESKVLGEIVHDELEGVVGIDFDTDGRMITGGGQNIKIWQESLAADIVDVNGGFEAESNCISSDEGEENEGDGEEKIVEEDESDDEEERRSKRRKKRKHSKRKGKKNENGIPSFKDLD